MCGDNQTFEETATHGAIGRLGINYDALNRWARQYFNLRDSSWNPFGVYDPNNKNLPYGKVINSIFLIGYALVDDNNRQWHSTEDYESLAAARSNRFHDDMYLRIITAGSSDATAHTGGVGTNHTDLHCTVFRRGSRSNEPSHRAGTLVHEAWHHWQNHNDFTGRHPTGGAAAGWPGGGDHYYFHRVSRYAFGQLHGWSTNPSNFAFHSPYQVQAEFYADLAEMSRSEIPTLVTQTARARGNELLGGAFVNAASYRIGQPRPW